MKVHRDASKCLPGSKARCHGRPVSGAVARALLLLFANFEYVLGTDFKRTAVAPVFASDEAILSDNTDAILRHASKLAPDQQFELLSEWVLPSNSHPGFRMKATFVPSDASPGQSGMPAGSTVEGIRTPVFLLIAVAQETNRLNELRQTVVMLEHPDEPHEQRAKLALLFMLDSANGDREAAAESLSALSGLVRSRSKNLDGRWWPETLALAYGMQHSAPGNEMLEFVTSIYDPQIGQSIWSGATEWDLFVAGCFARLQPPEQHATATQTAFVNWIPSSVFTAESRGRGFPDSNWICSGNTVRKVGGHNGDLLYLPVPLTGNFEVTCDVTSFDYREAALAYAGRYVQHHWTRTDVEIGTVRGLEVSPLEKPITNPDSWLTSRIKVQDGVVTHDLNGRTIWQRPLPVGSSPWLALRAFRLSRGSIRNLAIAGTPVIPESLDLSASSELDGWYSYFNEPVAVAADPTAWTLSSSEDSPPEIHHPRQPELSGAAAQSLLVYHRPVIEDGVLEYDFYYAPGDSIVHPAIDRMVLLLTPEGVRSHSVKDGKWQRDTSDPQDVSDMPSDPVQGSPLNLQSSAWNHLQLQFEGRHVQLVLNGTVLCRTGIPESSSRQFGLFHYAGESSVRVRNVQWSADWQMKIDSPTLPGPTQADVAEIERVAAALPFTRSQSLSNMDRHGDYIIRKGSTVRGIRDGVELSSVSTGGWSETRLPLWMNISGDFDLQASFTNFVHGTKGEAGLRLATLLDGSLQRIELSRNAGNDQQQKLKTQISILKPDGQREYFDRWSTSEVTAGTLRIVRLGTRLHYLLAENDSRIFRLLGTDNVSTDALRVGDLSLATYTDKLGASKVTWTSILIRATELSGDPIPDLRLQAKELDERRDSMRVILNHDFATTDPAPAGFYRWSDLRPWSKSNGGLDLNAAGADTWQSAGISTQLNVAGDFDVRIEFDSLKLALPSPGQQSGLHFQIEPATARSVELNSMIGVDATGILEAEGYTRTELPDGQIEFRGTERHSITSATALRIVRQGSRYYMLVRAEGESEDRIVSITENTTAPMRTLRITLHTGGAGRESSMRLKRLEVLSMPGRVAQ